MSLHRTQVLLEEWQHVRLKEAAADAGVSLSEMLRRILSEELERMPRKRQGILALRGIGKRPGVRLKDLDEELYGSEP
ncbi:MAG: hypothetical protein KY455_06975 [Euryarchaeota archaeon]|nr:hypothetical protein [Euryarchaeota archaeon]